MYRLVATLLMLATAAPSLAADVKICVVDAESAINATREGKAAQASLKTSYAAKESELEAKRAKLQADIEDYEQRRLILSEDARRQEEQRLEQMTQEFQMLLGQADAEMQQTYMKLLEDLQVKLLEVASSLGARQGCTVLLQKAAAIYTDSSVLDLTEMLVKEYDQR